MPAARQTVERSTIDDPRPPSVAGRPFLSPSRTSGASPRPVPKTGLPLPPAPVALRSPLPSAAAATAQQLKEQVKEAERHRAIAARLQQQLFAGGRRAAPPTPAERTPAAAAAGLFPFPPRASPVPPPAAHAPLMPQLGEPPAPPALPPTADAAGAATRTAAAAAARRGEVASRACDERDGDVWHGGGGGVFATPTGAGWRSPG
eukprot:gene24062-9416_t